MRDLDVANSGPGEFAQVVLEGAAAPPQPIRQSGQTFTSGDSECVLRLSLILYWVTYGPRLRRGADLFLAVTSVMGNECLNGLSPFETIARTMDCQTHSPLKVRSPMK